MLKVFRIEFKGAEKGGCSAFDQRIKMIEQRLNEASCGKWRRGKKGHSVVSDIPASIEDGSENAKIFYGGCLIAESIAPENVDFIACAKDDVAYLLGNVAELLEENKRIKEQLKFCQLKCRM